MTSWTKKALLLPLTLAVVGYAGWTAMAAEGAKEKATTATENVKTQSTCPIMGGAINKALYVDAKGKRIYVCCGGCIAKVKKDPEAALKTLAERGETVEATPAPEKDAASGEVQGKNSEEHAHH